MQEAELDGAVRDSIRGGRGDDQVARRLFPSPEFTGKKSPGTSSVVMVVFCA